MIADLFLMEPLQLSRLAETIMQNQFGASTESLKEENSSTVNLKMLVKRQEESHAEQDSGIGHANPDAQPQLSNVKPWILPSREKSQRRTRLEEQAGETLAGQAWKIEKL